MLTASPGKCGLEREFQFKSRRLVGANRTVGPVTQMSAYVSNCLLFSSLCLPFANATELVLAFIRPISFREFYTHTEPVTCLLLHKLESTCQQLRCLCGHVDDVVVCTRLSGAHERKRRARMPSLPRPWLVNVRCRYCLGLSSV